MDLLTGSSIPFMAAKKTSIALEPQDLIRFRKAADDRGLSVSAFLKRSADAALAIPDPKAELRAFSADLRADLRTEFAKVYEAIALNDERHRASADELRRLHLAFLYDLNEQQKEAVKVALGIGRQHGQAEALAKKNPANTLRPSATPLT